MAGVAATLLGALAATPCAAQGRDEAYEARLLERLKSRDPSAAEVFAQATAARDSHDLDKAAGLYREAADRLPGVSAPLRRLCGVELDRGNRDKALELCNQALRLEDLSENETALAIALLTAPAGAQRTEADAEKALRLAAHAANRDPDSVYPHAARCQAALVTNSLSDLKACSARLATLAPQVPVTHVYLAIDAATDGRFGDALEQVDRAEALGLPAESAAGLRSDIQASRPWTDRWLPLIGRVSVGWLAGLVSLFGLGMLLSRLTLLQVNRGPRGEGADATTGEKLLRRLYRGVLWVCCAYYYISLPIVGLSVVLIAGGLIYGMLAVGHIPIKLLLIVGMVALVTVWSMLKSIFVRGKDTDPGARLDLAEHPKLRDVLQEAATRIGTRPVDNVYLTPGTEVAVFERGGLWRQLTGKTERCLVLGAGILEGFDLTAFKAVLAHEYGHFRNEDTAGGGFALAVRRSLMAMAIGLARGGAAAWYNPAWLFVQGFHRVFLRISQGASRLQEVLADRWAAFAYGAESFTRGLRHVVERSIRFDVHVQRTIGEVIDARKALPNLYAYAPAGNPPPEAEVEQVIDERMNAKPTPYDSHPSPKDRIEWVRAVQKGGPESLAPGSGEDDAWSLLSDRAALEKKMTELVRDAVETNHGVFIPDDASR